MKESSDSLTVNVDFISFDKYAWVILIVVYISGVAAALNQFKVPPIMLVLVDKLNISLVQVSSITSLFSIAGVILSIPAAMIIQRFGHKQSGLFGLFSLAVGALIGFFSSTYELLLLSRVIEGIGMGFIGVVAPSLIAIWFPKEKQGTPMGIWSTWVPMGMLLMYLLAPIINDYYEWKSIWLFGFFFTVFTIIVFFFLIKVPQGAEQKESIVKFGFSEIFQSIKQIFEYKDVLYIALVFFLISLVGFPLSTLLPSFLSEVRGFSLIQASQTSSIVSALGIVSALITGWLYDNVRSTKLLMNLHLFVYSLIAIMIFRVEGWFLIVLIGLVGVFIAMIPTVAYSLVGRVVQKSQLVSISLGVLGVAQNFATLIGPVIFSKLVELFNWTVAGSLLLIFTSAGFFIVRLIKTQ